MPGALSPAVSATLACSSCGKALESSGAGARCTGCGLRYPATAGSALDLRLQGARRYELSFELGTAPPPLKLAIEPLTMNPRAEVDFADMQAPYHMTRELMSYFPKAGSARSLMLDLACCDGVHRELGERAGFEWVGADYDPDSKAPILADAHTLPFKDQSFDFLLCVAALHLFRYPMVAIKEASRVLKPGGVFIGTVAFLEPFHDGGYYHHTHLGVLNTLQFGGFDVDKLAPSREWTSLTAQAQMQLFPRMPGIMSRAIVFPVHLLHRLWWQAGRAATRNPNAQEDVRVRNLTGAFSFVAHKRADHTASG
jgi:SAM-dependent methyltransferase